VASPPASLMPFNSASACGVVSKPLCTSMVGYSVYTTTKSSTYHLLDVAVHRVVNDCDLGRHCEEICAAIGVSIGR
jgi:hypothetical protein